MNYTYDNNSRLTQVTDPTGTYQFTFDNMGRLTSTNTNYSFLAGRTFTNAYTYDAASNRTGFTDPEAGSTAYVYDTLNRLQTLTPPSAFATGSFGFTYDALNRRTQMTRPNNVATNYSYDNLSRLLSVSHQVGASTIDGATYTVDNGGNRTSKLDRLANITSNFSYDDIYQLKTVTQGASTTESYTYDPVGNRLSSLGLTPYAYNVSNQLSSTPNATYTFDNNGSTLTKTDSTGATSYTWDFENRLTSVTLPGAGGTISFAYDPFGRRIKKSSSSGTSVFAYDGDNLIEETNAAGGVVARYSEGLKIDEPLAMLRSGTTSYYNADGLGSVTSLSNAAGAVAQTYSFDSFGKQTASSGSLTNRFQYTAREFDPETNLYFYRARYYDQVSGRFISEDPLKFRAGINFYSYVWNRPTGFVDPTGKWAGGLGGTAAGIIGTLAAAGAAEGSCSVVRDSEGNWGLLCCLAFGGGVAAGADAGLSVSGIACPTCKTICDLEGGFISVQGFGALGGGLTGGGGASLGLHQATFSGNIGAAGGVGGGAAVLGGSCKLVLGGKKCRNCPANNP